GQFSILPENASIEAGNEQEFTLTFAPTTDGNKSCVFEFIHNGITSPDTVTATGTGALIGSISGTVFNDSNGNGQKDIGELGLQNRKIKIVGTTSDETEINDSLLSDANGFFSFDSLVDGNYTISQVAQTGWLQTIPVSPSTYLIVFSGGTDVTEKDFGNIQLSSINGNVYSDANDNGVKDDGETGISNWRIRLTGTATDSVMTDVSGNYSFSNLMLGTYTVAEDTQSGYVRTLPAFPGSYQIEFVFGGQNSTGNNFGNLLDTMKFRTFKPTDGLSSKPVKIRFNNKTNKIVSVPNEATALQAVFVKIGKAGKTFLGVEQTAKDSIKKYAWVFYKKGADPNRGGDAISNLFTSPHTGDIYPLDSLRKTGKKSRKLKGIVKADFKNYNNKAIEQGVLLRLNIRASSDTVLPLGFGDLVITKTDTCFGRPIYGMTIAQLATLFDSVMTYYKSFGLPDSLSGNLALATFVDSIIRPLNETFVQDLDSSNYTIDTAGVKVGKNGYDIALKGIKTARTAGIGVKNGKTITGSFGETRMGNSEISSFELFQNYPNPFNPQTVIGFSMRASGNVTLKIFDVLGQEVKILLNNEQLESGTHEMEFDGSKLSSGVYFYHLNIDGRFSDTKKFVLLK
ncbi:MAG: SdrD B-like domain-containing protein, partial [Bacteroidota bacterium]